MTGYPDRPTPNHIPDHIDQPSGVVCRKCGSGTFRAAARGAYLTRVNALGEIGIWECAPSCEHQHGDQNDALLGALEDAAKS